MLTITTAALSAAKPRATMMSLYKDQPGKIKKTRKAYLKCIFLCKTQHKPQTFRSEIQKAEEK